MNRDEIKHIADIAQIDFTEDGLKAFEQHFSETMDLIDQIKKIDTEGVGEVFQVNGTVNNLRRDELKNSLEQKEALQNTQDEKYGYFKLMKFVD